MKKNRKVFVCIIIIIISIIGIYLTLNYEKNSLNVNNDIQATEVGGPPSNMQIQNNKLSSSTILIIGLLCGVFSITLIYLLMDLKNNQFYKNKDKLIVYILGNIVLITTLTMGIVMLSNNILLSNKSLSSDEEKDKVTLNESNVANEKIIDLNSQDTDITITSGGSYQFNGTFSNSIIVDAENEEVEIVLNGVEINNEKTAAIIGLSASKITIVLKDETTNVLNDGGNSEYDGCIFSNTELIFDGNGTLIVNGNQNEGEGIATEGKNLTFNNGTYIIKSNDDGINAGGDGATITFNNGVFYIDSSGDGIDSNKNVIINGGNIFVIGSDVGGDAGIDTDDGFEINGGMLVALGSDMIEMPLETSVQRTIAFSLDQNILKDTIVTLMKDDEVIVSFQASKSFKTIIISSDNLQDGNYSLYEGGNQTGELINGIYVNGTYTKGNMITVNNTQIFAVSQTINLFGNKIR